MNPQDTNNQLHALLSEMVQAYTQRNQSARIPTPAEIGNHLHPILDQLCEYAEQREASDIFISTGFPPAVKINSQLMPLPHPAFTAEATAAIANSTMNPEQKIEFNRELELNYAVQSRSGTRYRVNAYHEQGRVGLVLRRINQRILSIEELGLPPQIKELATRQRGLIILAGPTGSGKSTSLAAMIEHRNRTTPGHIITIEDPIEYLYKPSRCIITQREIGIDTPGWKTAVQNSMRQSSDVVCIGEVRNEESMEYALQLAQTGRLCIFTLHASNAPQAIERIINFYQENRRLQVLTDLAMNLAGIITQRLVIKKDGSHTAITDFMLNSPAIQDLIFKGELLELRDVMARDNTEGMHTFDQNLFELYSKGDISSTEALRHADSPHELEMHIHLHEEGGTTNQIYNRISDLNLIT